MKSLYLKKIFCILLGIYGFLFAKILCYSQLQLQFQKNYGGNATDFANSVTPAPDGGYIIVGQSNTLSGGDINLNGNTNKGLYDFLVIKTNSAGTIVWLKNLGGAGNDVARTVKYYNNTIWVAGYTLSNNSGDVGANKGNEDVWLVKLDNSGTLLNQYTFGGNNTDVVQDILPTADGGCILVGYTSSTNGDPTAPVAGQGARDAWRFKINNAGSIISQSRTGGTGDDMWLDIINTSDGGFAIGGFKAGEASIEKYDSFGNIVFSNTYGGNGSDEIHGLCENTGGGILAVGQTFSSNISSYAGGGDLYFLSVSSTGLLLSHRAISGAIISGTGTGSDIGRKIIPSGDGNFYITGKFSNSHENGWLLKTNSVGTILMSSEFGGSGQEDILDIFKENNGDIVMAGAASSSFGIAPNNIINKGNEDFWLFKVKEGPYTITKNFPTKICPSQKIKINFSQNQSANTGNLYTVQLSNASGSFINPVAIGTLSGILPNEIEAQIPTNTPTGTGYRIRVIGSNPSVIGIDNGFDISIGGNSCCISPTEWVKTLGGSGEDFLNSVIQTSDGGFLLAGEVGSNNGDITNYKGGEKDAWLVKLDANRNIIWQKTYGGNNTDEARIVKEVSNGYIFVGRTASNDGDINGASKGGYDIWVVKVNLNGAIDWHKTIGSSALDVGMDIEVLSDGYIISGEVTANNGDVSGTGYTGSNDFFVCKLSLDGQSLLWKKSYGGAAAEQSRNVKVDKNGDIYVIGFTDSNSGSGIVNNKKGGRDLWLLKLNATGELIWQKCYGGSQTDEGYTISINNDNTVTIGGLTDSSDGDIAVNKGGIDNFILKIDPNGSIIWSKTYGSSSNEIIVSSLLMPDGNNLVYGWTAAASDNGDVIGTNGDLDSWLLNINKDGSIKWKKTFGGSLYDAGTFISLGKDNSYLLGGATSSNNGNIGFNSGGRDFFIAKLSAASPQIFTTTSTICNGGSATLTVNGCNGTVTWNTGATTTSITVTPTVNTTYTVSCQSSLCTTSSEITIAVNTVSPKPVKLWDRTYGGSAMDQLIELKVANDGGLILGGTSFSGQNGNKTVSSWGDADIWIVKTDKNGNNVQQNRYGGSLFDPFSTIIPTSDGKYIIGGAPISPQGSGNGLPPGPGKEDYWIFKVPAGSDAIESTQERFGGIENDLVRSIIPISTGGYLLVGQSNSPAITPDKTQSTKGDYDFWIKKVDSNFNGLWDKSRGNTSKELLSYNSAIETSDGGFLLVGSTNSSSGGDITPNSRGGYDYWLLKLDNDGNYLWDKRFGGSGNDMVHSILPTIDGGYLLIGESNSGVEFEKSQSSFGGVDTWIVKVDMFGNKVWDKTFGGTGWDNPETAIKTIDGNYIIAGRSNSGVNLNGGKSEQNLGSYDLWLLKIDNNGNLIWDKTFGGSGEESPTSIVQTLDGGYVVGGLSNSGIGNDKSQNWFGDFDYWILKFAEQSPPLITANRSVLCNGQSATLKVTNCLGQVMWSNGAVGDSLVVSPLVTNIYTANCNINGQTSCPSAPITITVCQPGSQSTFGYTAGTFQATDGGAAIYSIPIVMPSGSAGVKPELSVTYNSQGGNGIMGVGWSLDGLQVINRSSKTRAQDEAFDFTRNSAIGISLSKEDRFSLNGSRLVLAPNHIQNTNVLNANYGRKGTEYYTEQNQFIRVSIPDTLANGAPQYFLAHTKDGLILDFGNSLDARIDSKDGVPITYLINKITDRTGNYIRYFYDKQTEGIANSVYPYGKINTYPIRIEYTANDNSGAAFSAFNKVEFEYIPRTDKQWSFVKGSYIGGGDKLLSKIKVSGKNAQGAFVEVRRYELTYVQSKFTGNSILYQIRECADTLCHEPTIFNWQNEEKTANDLTFKEYNTTNGPFPADAYIDVNRQRLFGDWDGDGTNDLFVLDKNNGQYSYYLNRYPTSVPNGYNNTSQFPYNTFPTPIKGNFRTVDFNVDGKTDIFWWDPATGAAKIIFSGYVGGQLQFMVKDAVDFIPNITENGQNLYTQFFQGREIEIVDWNSDGITDLVSILKANKYYSKGSDIWLQTQPPTYQNPSIGSVIMKRHGGLQTPIDVNSQNFNRWQIADFNNDGLSDVCLLDTATAHISIYKMLSNKTGDTVYDPDSLKTRIQDPTYGVSFTANPIKFNWSVAQNRFIPFDGQSYNFYNRPFFTSDVNGDGLPDIVVKMSETSYQFQISTGDFGFFEDTYSLSAAQLPLGGDVTVDLTDINNDGQVDLLTYNRAGYAGSSVRLGGFDRKTLDFSNPLHSSLLNDLTVNFFFGNYSKTNLNDLLFYKVDGTTLTSKVYNNNLSKSDLIGSINEGAGQEISITYKTLKDPSVYTRTAAQFRYPLFEFTAPISVVSSVRSKDGIGGFVYTDYFYEGAFSHSAGRGFRGFSKVITKDRQRNTFDIKFYTIDANKWWLAGQPYRTELRKDNPTNGQLLSLYEATFGTIPYTIPTASGTYMKSRSYYTYGKVSVARTYDLNTVAQTNITTSRVTQDSYGNSLRVVVDHGDNVKDSTISQYTDNISSWLLGRLTRSTVYRFSPGKPTSVRTVGFEYNPTTGQLTKEISDPDSTIQIKRETIYTHDAAGNITRTEVKAWNGTQIESRATQFQFDNQKRLKLSITNPLGHQVLSAFNVSTGSIATTTDINGLTDTFEHDAFQRIIKVTDATGVESVERIYRAGPTWNSPQLAKFVMYKKQGNSPAVIEHYDILGRMIQVDKANFSGNSISYTITFNNKGEKVLETGPGENKVYQYDLMSRVTRMTDFGEDNIYEYIGNQTTVTDIKGRKRIIEKNSQGQLLNSRWQSSNGSVANQRLDYEYDGRNNPTRVVGNTNGFEVKNIYDARGYKIRMEDPVMGTYRYENNGFGEMTKQVDPKGNVITMEYDKLGRVTKRTEPEGITTYVYDVGNKAKGKLTSVTGYGGIVYAYTYDNFGRTATETKTINATNYVSSYQYTADSKVDRITYPSGLIVKHEYNSQDYLHIVRRVADNKVLWRAKTANAVDNILTEDVYEKGLGQNAVLRHTYTYDVDLSHITQYQTFLPADVTTPRLQRSLGYDNRYFINSVSETIYNNSAQIIRTGSTNYTYDDLDRLTAVSPTINFPLAGQNENTATTMTYDIYGNILSKSDVGNYIYDQNALGGPRYLTRIDLVNPAVCVPSFKVTTDFTSFNKVKRIANDSSYAVITYGPDRARVMQQLFVNNKLTKTKIYVNSLYEVEIVGTQTKESSYIRGGSGVVAVETKIGTVRTIQLWVKDHANNLVAVVDTNGNILQQLRYDVWGRRMKAEAAGYADDNAQYLNDRGFTKHEHLDLFQMINMNGRIYDPVIARFISPDPFIQDALDLQSYNRYAYVQNNPVMFTDPSGYFLKRVARAIAKGVDFISNNAAKYIGVRYFLELKTAYHSVRMLSKVLDSKAMPTFVRNQWREVVIPAASMAAGAIAGFYSGGNPQAIAAAQGFTSGFVGSAANGGSYRDAVRAGVKGAIVGVAFSYISSAVGVFSNDIDNPYLKSGIKAIEKGVVSGVISESQGGNFWEAAKESAIKSVAEDFGEGLKLNVYKYETRSLNILTSAIIGGTMSSLNGGKFSNGAISGFAKELISPMRNTMSEEEKLNQALNNFNPLANGVIVAENKYNPDESNQELNEITRQSFWDFIRSLRSNAAQRLRRGFELPEKVGDKYEKDTEKTVSDF